MCANELICELQFSYCRSHPLHISSFGGKGSKLLEAQGRRLSGETGIFKQAARLHTFLLQCLIVLVGKLHCLLIGAHALCP